MNTRFFPVALSPRSAVRLLAATALAGFALAATPAAAQATCDAGSAACFFLADDAARIAVRDPATTGSIGLCDPSTPAAGAGACEDAGRSTRADARAPFWTSQIAMGEDDDGWTDGDADGSASASEQAGGETEGGETEDGAEDADDVGGGYDDVGGGYDTVID